MKEIEVEIHCCLCSEKWESKIFIPDNWDMNVRSFCEEFGFCPKHFIVKKWSGSQCSGCVEGWGDCALWHSFAYRKVKITETDLQCIRQGKCPMRTNGTIGFSRETGIVNVDLSETASLESGNAFADAIVEYIKRFNETD